MRVPKRMGESSLNKKIMKGEPKQIEAVGIKLQLAKSKASISKRVNSRLTIKNKKQLKAKVLLIMKSMPI